LKEIHLLDVGTPGHANQCAAMTLGALCGLNVDTIAYHTRGLKDDNTQQDLQAYLRNQSQIPIPFQNKLAKALGIVMRPDQYDQRQADFAQVFSRGGWDAAATWLRQTKKCGKLCLRNHAVAVIDGFIADTQHARRLFDQGRLPRGATLQQIHEVSLAEMRSRYYNMAEFVQVTPMTWCKPANQEAVLSTMLSPVRGGGALSLNRV